MSTYLDDYYREISKDPEMLQGIVTNDFEGWVTDLTLLDLLYCDTVDLSVSEVQNALMTSEGTQGLYKQSLSLYNSNRHLLCAETYMFFCCLIYYYYQCMWGSRVGIDGAIINKLRMCISTLTRFADDEAPINYVMTKDA